VALWCGFVTGEATADASTALRSGRDDNSYFGERVAFLNRIWIISEHVAREFNAGRVCMAGLMSSIVAVVFGLLHATQATLLPLRFSSDRQQ